MMAGQRTDEATRNAISKELGLDKPLHVQFIRYLKDLSPIAVHKDDAETKQKYEYVKLFKTSESNALVLKSPYLRKSFQSNQRVDDILLKNIEATFWLAFASMLFATVFGIIFWNNVCIAPGYILG